MIKLTFRRDILDKLGFGKELNYTFADTVVEYARPYTPEDKDNYDPPYLRENVTISSNKSTGIIVYNNDYADYQYNTSDEKWHRHTPDTHSAWIEGDKRFDGAWNIHKKEIVKAVDEKRIDLSH